MAQPPSPETFGHWCAIGDSAIGVLLSALVEKECERFERLGKEELSSYYNVSP